MCLVFIVKNSHPDYPLIIAANRDEYFSRPSQAMHQWLDHDIVAGRDLLAGGTWLGASRKGRIAAVTNIRSQSQIPDNAMSRGTIPLDYLTGNLDIHEFMEHLQAHADNYAGFNGLFISFGNNPLTDCTIAHFNNHSKHITFVEDGIFGISNASIDTPWPKVISGKEAIKPLLEKDFNHEDWFGVLADDTPAKDKNLPDTGIGLDSERGLSPRFIKLPNYGTRSSTLVSVSMTGRVTCCERVFNEKAEASATRLLEFGLCD